MPKLQITETDGATSDATTCYLVCFDEQGNERREEDGAYMRDTLWKLLVTATTPFTDIFIFSHGWKGDVPSATDQYMDWIRVMAEMKEDREKTARDIKDFKPLIVGIHWPSLLWGDETLPNMPSLLLNKAEPPLEDEISAYKERISNTEEAKDAIGLILESARNLEYEEPESLSEEVRDAYERLFRESKLQTKGDPSDKPGEEMDKFRPQTIIEEALKEEEADRQKSSEGKLSYRRRIQECLKSPLRQLSFWKMKDRARIFGEAGGNDLLRHLQYASPDSQFHLMGHSFGCIAVTAMVAGSPDKNNHAEPIHSLFLVQGALSLWSYAEHVGQETGGVPGYFWRIVGQLVRGPILATCSDADTALSFMYPLGARISRQAHLANPKLPRFGAVGTWGIRGLPKSRVTDLDMNPSNEVQLYDFKPGKIYNIDASKVIRNGKGLSGAHSDIAHRQVAHAFWAAVLAGPRVSRSTRRKETPEQLTGSEAERAEVKKKVKQGEFRTTRGTLASSRIDMKRKRESDEDEIRTIKKKNLVDVDPPRRVKAKIIGGKERHPTLRPREWYNFNISVSARQPGTAIFSTLEEMNSTTLKVQLQSDDFELSANEGYLQMQRGGASIDNASFGIFPKHDGKSTLRANMLKDGNFVQQNEYTWKVGEPPPNDVSVKIRGNLTSMEMKTKRDISITIQPDNGTFVYVLSDNGHFGGRLKISTEGLTLAVEEIRKEMTEIVKWEALGSKDEFPFLDKVYIPEEDERSALEKMAKAGHSLFVTIFNCEEDHDKLGAYLRRVLTKPESILRIKVVADRAPIPWGSLYLGETDDKNKLSWDNFIGMRHIVQQGILDCPDPVVGLSPTIPSAPKLWVGLNINDTHYKNLVAKQLTWWENRKSDDLNITIRHSLDDIKEALMKKETPDQIIYFYCHGAAAEPGTNPDAALLEFDKKLSLKELKRDLPINKLFQSNPLVFLNACDSSQMSAAFYEGFAAYFMRKGARGVVGTETMIPALFAERWAEAFFRRFLNGQSLGELFLDLRREFLTVYNNPLGLLYTIYCDVYTCIRPAPLGIAWRISRAMEGEESGESSGKEIETTGEK